MLPRAQAVVVGLLALAIFYLVLPPLGALVLGALTSSPRPELQTLATGTLIRAYSAGTTYSSLLNSLIYASSIATIVLVIGGFLAWLVERTDSGIRRLTGLFTIAPLLIPAVLLISGWIMLAGPGAGLINQVFRDYFGFDHPVVNLLSFGGMIWVGVLQELPLAFLWMWPAFRSANPALEEAALVSGASTWTTVRRILIPILRPTLVAAWVIFFVYSLGMLMVPLLIGLPSRIFLFSTEIFLAARRVPPDLNLAAAYCLLLVAVTFVGIYVYWRATGDASRFVTVTGKGYRPFRITLGVWQIPLTAGAILLLLVMAGLPLAVVVWNAFMPYPHAPNFRSLHLATLDNFVAAWQYGPATRAVVNSLVLGIGAGLVTTAIGGPLAWCILRMHAYRRIINVLDMLSTAPIAIPGLIVGVSLLWLYLLLPLPIYGTHWILLIAYVTLHLPYAVRICASALTQVHPELDEAAYVAGAGWWTTLRRILTPLISQSVIVSVMYVMLRSFREYAASIFLTGVGTEVFSVLVLDMWEGGNYGVLAAYVTMVLGLLIAAVLAFNFVSARTGIKI
jgi:iron(III) transport system permease protein